MIAANKVFIIAEAGVNHNGNVEIARKMVDKAVEAGVDAVKFQSFKAKKVISKFAPKAEYQKKDYTIVIYSARSWQKCEMAATRLKDNGIKYHQLFLGKPTGDIRLNEGHSDLMIGIR